MNPKTCLILMGVLPLIACGEASSDDDASTEDAITASGGAVDTTFGTSGRLRLDGLLQTLPDGSIVDAAVVGDDLVVERRNANGKLLTSGFGQQGKVKRKLAEIGALGGYASGVGQLPLKVRFCGLVTSKNGTIALSGLAREDRPGSRSVDAGFVVLVAPDGSASTFRKTAFDVSGTATCGILGETPHGLDVTFLTTSTWGVAARLPLDATISPEVLGQTVQFGGGLVGNADANRIFPPGGGSVRFSLEYPGAVRIYYSRPDTTVKKTHIDIDQGSFIKGKLGDDGNLRLLFSNRIETRDLEGNKTAPDVDISGQRCQSIPLGNGISVSCDVTDFAIDSAGRTWVAWGSERTPTATMDKHRVARYLPTGALDTAFAQNGVTVVRGTKAQEDVLPTLLVQNDKVLVRSTLPTSAEATYLRLR